MQWLPFTRGSSCKSNQQSQWAGRERKDLHGHFFLPKSSNQMCEDSTLNPECMEDMVWYSFLWSLAAFCKRKNKQHQKKTACKKRVKRFSAEAIFQEVSPFHQPAPCLESPAQNNMDKCSLAKCRCCLLKMHLCFKVLLTELHWMNFKKL